MRKLISPFFLSRVSIVIIIHRKGGNPMKEVWGAVPKLTDEVRDRQALDWKRISERNDRHFSPAMRVLRKLQRKARHGSI